MFSLTLAAWCRNTHIFHGFWHLNCWLQHHKHSVVLRTENPRCVGETSGIMTRPKSPLKNLRRNKSAATYRNTPFLHTLGTLTPCCDAELRANVSCVSVCGVHSLFSAFSQQVSRSAHPLTLPPLICIAPPPPCRIHVVWEISSSGGYCRSQRAGE